MKRTIVIQFRFSLAYLMLCSFPNSVWERNCNQSSALRNGSRASRTIALQTEFSNEETRNSEMAINRNSVSDHMKRTIVIQFRFSLAYLMLYSFPNSVWERNCNQSSALRNGSRASRTIALLNRV
jgi:hypothetical protein